MTRLPLPARWLLRLSPVPPGERTEVQADLHELFAGRRRERGVLHAHWRLYHDLASLWLRPQPAADAAARRSPFALLRDARGDMRFALRLFARQPGILLLTIAGLSLGLGISTAAFSIMNAATLRGEGLADSNRAPAVLRATDNATWTVWRYDEFLRLREGATRMGVEALLSSPARVGTAPAEENPPAAVLAFVSGGFFRATGGRVMAGRPLESADERHDGAPPVVVSFAFWTTRLNRDPGAVGRTIQIGRTTATIVGVAERGFTVPRRPVLWMPLTAYGAVYSSPLRRTPDMVDVFGRLLPGVSLAEAEAQLSGVAAALDGSSKEAPLRVRLDPDAGLGRSSAADTLAITVPIFAVIVLVLVLACANVATVLVSTAITREREMGVRAALGASRGRIVRQLITESLFLGTLAALAGLLLAYWTIPVIGRMIEAPAGTDLAPDLNVYLFLGIVTLVTGVAAGLAPARHGRGVDLLSPLKGVAPPHRLAPRRLRSLLVMTQAAVSVLLIVLATLFTRATFRAAATDPGFEAAGLYSIAHGLGDQVAEQEAVIRNFWGRSVAELQATPGVASVALSDTTPFGGLRRSAQTREQPARVIHLVGTQASYFETLGLRTLAGRTFTPAEVAARAPVAVVSDTLARAYWPGQSPLGQPMPSQIPMATTRPVVIGIVADALMGELHERNTFAIYEPLAADYEKWAQLLVRVTPGSTGVIERASPRLRSIDPQADVRITNVGTLLERQTGRPRMLATLSGVVGVLAIILCAIGLYGLTASVVGQRSREMAVRAAIGAERSDLLRLLMWDSLKPVAAGLVLGAGAALLASRVALAAFLFGVSPMDPIAFGAAAAILLAAATLAVLVPTRRAAAVDAASVLRQS